MDGYEKEGIDYRVLYQLPEFAGLGNIFVYHVQSSMVSNVKDTRRTRVYMWHSLCSS
jgi:hypothetical protein